MKWVLIVIGCVVVAASAAFLLESLDRRGGYGSGYSVDPERDFKDEVATNVEVATGALDFTFTDLKGKPVPLADYRGKQNVVLIFTRGFPGYVCPHCSALTSRLIAQQQEFKNRNAAVLVVFPGPTEHLQEFIKTTEHQAKEKAGMALNVPFPILLDIDFKAVDRLGLRDDLAKPSTYVLDKNGDLRFAYVGANSADRPSVKAILSQLDAIETEAN